MTFRPVFHPPEITGDDSPLAQELAVLLTRAILAELPAESADGQGPLPTDGPDTTTWGAGSTPAP